VSQTPSNREPLRKRLFPGWLWRLKQELGDCQSILDLGCGRDSAIANCKNVKYSVGVELFEPYLQESKAAGIHSEYIKANICEVEFEAKSFDAVVGFEVIEHLPQKDGLALLKKMEGWARKKVIITTPNGFVQQGSYDENELQEHKSGWTIEELQELGFRVHVMNGWKGLRKGHRGEIKYRPYSFWAKVSHLSQQIVYYYPELAF
jgi:SAM-dependent methyltransferase